MKRRYFTDQQIAEAIKRYINGETITDIAQDLNIYFTTMNNWLNQAKVKRRARPVNNWKNIKSLIKK